MNTTVTKLLATVAAASTIFGMSALPALAAEGSPASDGNAVNISDINATAETRALFANLANSVSGSSMPPMKKSAQPLHKATYMK